MQPRGGRRMSMFDATEEMMDRRKSRLDSMVSFASSSDFDAFMVGAPGKGRRGSKLQYENTYRVRTSKTSNSSYYKP